MAIMATIVTGFYAEQPTRFSQHDRRLWEDVDDLLIGLPFMPLYKRPMGVWRFWCPVLDIKTGRCGDYENRPALCKSYRAGSDTLCAMHVPAPPRDTRACVEADITKEIPNEI
jgi:Fe-S-cluster containining protein